MSVLAAGNTTGKSFIAAMQCLALALICACAGPAVAGDESAPDLTEDLAAHQRLNETVEGAFRHFLSPPPGRQSGPETIAEAADMLASLGDAVLPYLENELELERRNRIYLTLYAMGRMDSPAVEKLLRDKITELDTRTGRTIKRLKAWTCYSLALQGNADAVELLNTEPIVASSFQIFSGIPTISVAAILTAPDSRQRLMKMIDELLASEEEAVAAGEEEKERHLIRMGMVLDALGHIADPSILPLMLKLVEHEEYLIRHRCITALGRLDDPAATEAIMKAMVSDPVSAIRQDSAHLIEQRHPASMRDRIVEILQTEEMPFVRGALYRTLGMIDGEKAADLLIGYWGSEEPRDRFRLLRAMGEIGSPRFLNIVRLGTTDPDSRVVTSAVIALQKIGTPGAVDTLLALVDDTRWDAAGPAISVLAEMGEKRLAERIVQRLVTGTLPGDGPVSERRTQVWAMCNTLVDLSYTKAIARIRSAIEVERDEEVKAQLADTVSKLSAIDANKDKVPSWIKYLDSPDRGIRHLSYYRLGELGGKKAALALMDGFEKADQDDRIEILHALGRAALPETAPLLEKILGKEYDTLAGIPQRNVAAWVAARIGGKEMEDLLRTTVNRRLGRDVHVVTALAWMTGEKALPLLRSTRDNLYRYFSTDRVEKQFMLDDLIHDLETGAVLEVPEDYSEDEHVH